MLFTSFYRCACGAISFITDDNRDFSCLESRLDKYLPREELDALCEGGSFDELEELPRTFSCNHCINHYGIDLCACGSGEEPDKCENGFDCCGRPMQSLKLGYTAVSANDAIGFPREFEIDEDKLLPYDNSEDHSPAALWEEAVAAQQKAKEFLKDSLDALLKEIQSATMDGVKTYESESVKYSIVKYSTLMSNDLVMSPMYYMPSEQAKLIQQKLKKPTEEVNMASFKKDIMEMLDKKSVTINKQSFRLNPNTLKVLKDFGDNIWQD